MKLLVVAAPIVALAFCVGWWALRGRPLSRRALNVVVSLFLLTYLIATASLGFFWVARMELPRFDWHYLFGYGVVLLAAVHVALQLGPLEVFFSRQLPESWVTPDRTRLKRGVALGVLGVLAVVALVPAAWLALLPRAPAKLTTIAASAGPSEIWIERGKSRMAGVDYLHHESSYTAGGLVARARFRLRGVPPPFKSYLDARRVKLPPAADRGRSGFAVALLRADLPDEPNESPDEEVTVAGLATLLHYGYGVTDQAGPLKLRAAASAGALYPTDVYALVRRVSGVESGLYYFDPRGPELVSVAGEEAAAAIASATLAGSPARVAPLVLVLGATFQRTAAKYRERAYRYVAMDAGHVAANFELAATGLGWRCIAEPLFDDAKLLAAVRGDPEREGVLLVLACGPGLRRVVRRPGVPPPHALPKLPQDLDGEELARLAHRMTSWELVAPDRAEPWLVEPAGGAEPSTRLAKRGDDVFHVIQRRRSERTYGGDTPLSEPELRRLLRDANRFAPLRGRTRFIETQVLVREVTGLTPGLYRYGVAHASELELVRSGDFSSQLQSAGLSQSLLGNADAVLVIAMRNELVGTLDGTRDYRTALLEAGLAGERAYLSATAAHLAVCGVGAFIDADIASLIQADKWGVSPLYLIALGRSAG